MSRITEIEIAGKKYPLNFSVKAAKEVSKRYGGVENVTEAFSSGKVDEMMDEATWILAVLMEQGSAYKKIIDGEEIEAPTKEELEIIMGVSDFANIQDALMGAMTSGMEREVEVEVSPKNAKTKQGK